MTGQVVDIAKLRRATAAAQAILKEVEPTLIVDGKPGTFTFNAYQRAPSDLKQTVDSIMMALGVPGLKKAQDEYKGAMSTSSGKASGNGSPVFDLQVVPAIIREARRRNLNPINYLTQLVIESGYGKRTPILPDGSPSHNYGGIKWKSDKTARKVAANTREYIKGQYVNVVDDFAVYDTPDEFAKAYFNYLFSGPSAHRYKGLENARTPFEHGAILQRGGYATDPNYANSFQNVASSVAKRYDLA